MPFLAAAAAEEAAVKGPKAEFILSFFGVPISNTVFSAWLVMAALVLFSILATRRMSLDKPSGLQNLAETVVEVWLGLVEQVAGRRGRRFFPLVTTSFIFILTANWIGTLPGFGDVTWLRSPNSDLNLTAAMAIMVFLATQFYGLTMNPGPRIKEFLWPPFLGQIHILTELVRPLSLALRLFGNMFAGSVLVHTIIGVAPFIAFIFLGLELFIGLVQAIIFAMLSLVFLTVATAHAEGHGHGEQAH